MNIHKVEELAKQIYGVKVTKNEFGNPMYEFTSTELAMFAELIIRECMDVVETAVNQREPASTYADKIKEHFGVE